MSPLSPAAPAIAATAPAAAPAAPSQAQFQEMVAKVALYEQELAGLVDEVKGDELSGTGVLKLQLTTNVLSLSVDVASSAAAAMKKNAENIVQNLR